MTGDVSVFFDDGVTLVRLSGEVDVVLGADLEHAARDAIDRYEPVVVDLTAVTFLDSVGLSFISRLVAAEFQVSRRVTVLGATGQVQYLLELSGLSPLLDQESADPDEQSAG